MANQTVDAASKRFALSVTSALKIFREASVLTLRGPTQAEFAEAAGMAGPSSSQSYYPKLEEIGWIARLDPESPLKGYVLTPAGERRYRELVDEQERKGPAWPTE